MKRPASDQPGPKTHGATNGATTPIAIVGKAPEQEQSADRSVVDALEDLSGELLTARDASPRYTEATESPTKAIGSPTTRVATE